MITRATLKTAFASVLLAGMSYGGYAQYCTPDPGGSGCSDGDDINTFVLNGESGTGINDQNTGCSGDGAYDDRTAESVSLAQTAIYTATISSEYDYDGSGDAAGIWIDLNDNDQFESSELVGSTDAVYAAGGNMNLTIPGDAPLGTHRMRVAVVYNEDIIDVDPCNTDGISWEYGEVHDYTVNILPPPACTSPQNLTVSSVTQNSATVTWDGSGTYVIEYGPAGYTPGTGTSAGAGGTLVSNAATSPVTISGLDGGTTYYVYIRQDCSVADNGYSTNSMTSFSTLISNEDCASAVLLSVDPGSACTSPTQYSNVGATGSAQLDCYGDPTENDVWFKFVATGTSQIISMSDISPVGSGTFDETDLGLAVYSGSCGALTPVGDCEEYFAGYYFGSDDNSTTISGLTVGQTYYIQVWTSYYDSSPDALFDLCVSTPPPPATNDLPENAITINVDQPCAGPYSNIDATASAGEPGADCSGSDMSSATVWFKFTAPSSGAVKVSTDYAGYLLQDSRIALFQVGDPTDYSTFQSLACDEDNGIENSDGSGDSYLSILYAAGLTPGVTYYIVVDKYSESDNEGDFCLTVNTLTDDMLSDGGDCESTDGNSTSESYHGWLSLVDDEGKLVSNVRVPADDFQDYSVTPYITVHTGAVREDANGLAYLDRNTYYDSYAEDEDFNEIEPTYDLQLFFKQSELDALGADLSTLNVTHAPGNACTGDFEGDGTQTALLTSAYGSSDNADWIQVSTPGFSNFFIMSGTTPLPIELKSIAAKNAGQYNIISWSTTRSDAGDYFELERSADGKSFARIATVNASTTQLDYTYNDIAPLAGINYYRLRSVNVNGRSAYSKVVTVTVDKRYAFNIQAVPNPVSGILHVNINGANDGTITITDIAGKVIRNIAVTASELQIDMSSIATGTYFLKYANDANQETLKIVRE